MERKRSVGVTIVSIIMFLSGLLSFYIACILRDVYHLWPFEIRMRNFFSPYIFGSTFFILTALIYCVSSLYILRLKNWARTIIVRYSTFFVIVLFLYFPVIERTPALGDLLGMSSFLLSCFISPLVLFSLIFLIFFTRPKVKEQFR